MPGQSCASACATMLRGRGGRFSCWPFGICSSETGQCGFGPCRRTRIPDSAQSGTDTLAGRRTGAWRIELPGEVELAALPPGPTRDGTAGRPLAGTARRSGGRCSCPDGCRAPPPKWDRTVRAHHQARASPADRHPDRTACSGTPAAPGCQNPPGHPAHNPQPPGDRCNPPRIVVTTLSNVANAAIRDSETGGLPGDCG